MNLVSRLTAVLVPLLACNIAVDGDTSGLSGGGGPAGGTQGAATGSGGATMESMDSTAGEGMTQGAMESGTATGVATEGNPPTTSGSGDTGSGDAGSESDGSTGDQAPGDPLHPDLDVPERGQVCNTPGSLGECPALEVCRFHTTEQGLCESCQACGNLGAPCVQGTDCDILFACYQGQCTNICELGTFYCGPIEDCLNVGHPTHGVCAPF
ncbi:MAG: hypothetical protein K0V04_18380 [Deltaproteobacteria bacterium]|nr:hypothetical protein [Deltaproteobacteria bacterium]